MGRQSQYSVRFEIVHLGQCVEEIESALSVKDLQVKLQSIIEDYGFCSFSFVDAGRPHVDKPYYLSTTSKAWEEEYLSNNFLQFDPIVSKARRSNQGFTWKNVSMPPRLGKRKPQAIQLMEAAHDHGFQNGYVFPFHFVDYQGRTYSTVNGLFWKDEESKLEFLLETEKRHELNLVLLYWTQRIIFLATKDGSGTTKLLYAKPNSATYCALTDREREVLTWAGRGITVTGTSEILKIGEETVQSHITHAVSKLGAINKTHAVAKAMQMGFVDL